MNVCRSTPANAGENPKQRQRWASAERSRSEDIHFVDADQQADTASKRVCHVMGNCSKNSDLHIRSLPQVGTNEEILCRKLRPLSLVNTSHPVELSLVSAESYRAILLALKMDLHPPQAVAVLQDVVSAHGRPAPPDKCQAKVSSASHRSGSNSANTGRP